MLKPYGLKVDWCEIIEDLCEEVKCEGCKHNTATEPPTTENQRYCEFVRDEHDQFGNHIMRVNTANTIGRISLPRARIYINDRDLKQIPFHPELLKQYPDLFRLKKTLRLGAPTHVYCAFNDVCVLIYPEHAYIIAAAIDRIDT